MISPHPLAATPWAQWNVALFLHMHATTASPPWLIALAVILARWALCAALAVAAWRLLHHRNGAGALRVAGAWLVSNRIEALVGAFAFHPRPFAAGYGPAWMAHAANNSMPSSHATLGLILVAVLVGQKDYRCGAAVAVLTAMLAWARIYVGIHWPADMAGAMMSAAVSMGVVYAVERMVVVLRKRLGKHQHPATST
jgi:undecaprenyl-diphosphatase